MFGILNLNKPAGWTSRDVVNRVQKLVLPYKAGHAGTLDPLATGVLVVCVGQATRLIRYIQQMPKEYRATFLLGRTSASDDVNTEVTEFAHAHVPSHEEIERAIPQFLGTIDQVPPSFSAVKIAGRRAYSLARQGQEIVIPPRPVTIYDIELLKYEYPRIELAIRCGSGTYVRSLGRDLAHSLGTAAVMSELLRTRIGAFSEEEAVSVENLTKELVEANIQPAAAAVAHLPQLQLTNEQIADLTYGRPVSGNADSECAGFDSCGRLIAVLKPYSQGLLRPHINFAPSA